MTAGTIEHVRFQNKDMYWEIAADIYFPKNLDASNTYPTIVAAHPIGSCKEQTSGNIYGAALSEAGFVVIAFDASFQGASGGLPRFLENPHQRVEDFSRVVDYAVTLPYVDAERIGVLGVCGGGGYTWAAAKTEKRFKAVVSITGANFGNLQRSMAAMNGGIAAALKGIAQQRTAEARGAESVTNAFLPETAEAAEATGDIDIIEAFDYYRTSRGQADNGCVLFEAAHSSTVLGWDALDHAEELLDQPLLIVIGDKDKQGAFGAYRDGHTAYEKAASTDKTLLEIPGASHYDLYDRPNGAGEALRSVIPFFQEKL
ncbi:alpha/beta hydrolase [Glutamicibacter uratoxydans]|uniref:Alpha/beta hydrolase n=1 Tax=Glutamicibacter uratoxydans TaxID=43667 RepID=A0A4Y4DTC8_GLUUR|nr:alpha/beta hydrolase [Glutamicibacter uratoxydans]GED07923.1 alpha/beta hydrolase [Glutamicibacter uratoxydans]